MWSCSKTIPTITLIGNIQSSSPTVQAGDTIMAWVNVSTILVHEDGIDFSLPSSSNFVVKKDGEKLPISLFVDYLLDGEVIASCERQSKENSDFSQLIVIPSTCRIGRHIISIRGYTNEGTWRVEVDKILSLELFISEIY